MDLQTQSLLGILLKILDLKKKENCVTNKSKFDLHLLVYIFDLKKMSGWDKFFRPFCTQTEHIPSRPGPK